MLAAIASIGLGWCWDPRPRCSRWGPLGLRAIRLLRKDAPPEVGEVLAAAGAMAGLSFLFDSPLIGGHHDRGGGIGGTEAAARAGSPASWLRGSGRWCRSEWHRGPGSAANNISLGTLPLPDFARPDVVDFAWTILVAAGVAVVTSAIFRLARATQRFAEARAFLVLPAVGLAVASLAVAFSEATGRASIRCCSPAMAYGTTVFLSGRPRVDATAGN